MKEDKASILFKIKTIYCRLCMSDNEVIKA